MWQKAYNIRERIQASIPDIAPSCAPPQPEPTFRCVAAEMDWKDSFHKFGQKIGEWWKTLRNVGSNAREQAGKLNRLPHP